MSDPSDDATHIEKLYEFGERLNESKDKSQVRLFPPFLSFLLCFHCFVRIGFNEVLSVLGLFSILQNVKDYQGIIDAAKTSIKAKQLAAQLIPRFFKFFPDLSGPAIDTHLDLIEEEELGVSILFQRAPFNFMEA